MSRRPVVAVVGSGGVLTADVEALARDLGRAIADAGLVLLTGGKGGVMAAASAGARSSPSWVEGRVIGLLPGDDRSEANAHVDLALPTGLGIARNLLIVRAADVVVAVSGGSGTLSEVALAWQLGRVVVALAPSGGWAAELAGRTLDDRRDDTVLPAETVSEAMELVEQALR